MSDREENKVLCLFIFVVLFLSSLLVWKLVYVRYDVGNFDVILVSGSPVFIMILTIVSSIILVRVILKNPSAYVVIFSYVSYFYMIYMGPFIANAPSFIHRDVFLHLPYSLYMNEYGHIPLFSDRLDVVSYPSSFILYSVYSGITNISDPRLLGLTMAMLYPSILAISMVVLTRNFLFRGADHGSYYRYIVPIIVVLPFISRFAPAPGFPHRYHLAFIQALLLLYIFTEPRVLVIQRVVCIVLLYLSIIFIHPYFSFLLATMMLLYPLLSFLKGDLGREKLTLMYIVVPMLFIIHTLYLAYTGILQETYRIILNLPDRLMDFVEVSLPVRVKSVEPLVTIASMVTRNTWRVYIAITTFGTAFIYMYVLRKGVKLYAVSLAMASIVLIPLLIGSFLWWERSLTFVALIILCALCEVLSINDEDAGKVLEVFRKYVLPAFFMISVIISPLIRWERPLLSDEWQGYEKEVFMNTIASYMEDPEIYIGGSSGVDYTYYRVYLYPHNAPIAKTIFDPVKGVLTKDISELTGIYAVSTRDPDYEVLNLEQLLLLKSLLWNSGTSYVFS